MTDIWDTLPAVSSAQMPRVVAWQKPAAAPPWRWMLAAAVVACVLIGFASTHLPSDPSYVTDTGEQRIVNLDDGSRVSLNSKTRLDVHYAERERRIVLEEGEAYFEVARDSQRPLVVVAGKHRITALGTTFLVRYESDRTTVTLVDGRVAVTTPQTPAPVAPVVLRPGERLTFAEGNVPKLDQPHIEAVAAWRRGEIIFDSTLLEDAVNEMNRYDKTPLVIDDPAIAELPVSGIYRSGDSRGFARMIKRMYGIRLVQEEGRIHLRQ